MNGRGREERGEHGVHSRRQSRPTADLKGQNSVERGDRSHHYLRAHIIAACGRTHNPRDSSLLRPLCPLCPCCTAGCCCC